MCLHPETCQELRGGDAVTAAVHMTVEQKVTLSTLLDAAEWRFLLSGVVPGSAPRLPNPAPSWLTDKAWTQMLNLSTLPRFQVSASGRLHLLCPTSQH